MKTRVLLTIIALFALMAGARAETVKVSGTVNVSTLADNAELKLTDDATLVVDVDKTLKSIKMSSNSKEFTLTIEGDKKLTVNNPNGTAIDVYRFKVEGDAAVDVTGKDYAIIPRKSIIVNTNKEVTLTGKKNAVDWKHHLSLEKGTLNAFGGISTATITVSDGTTLNMNNGNLELRDDDLHKLSGTINVTGGNFVVRKGTLEIYGKITVEQGSIEAKDGGIHIMRKAEVNVDSPTKGIIASSAIDIYPSTVTVKAVDNAIDGSARIYGAKVDVFSSKGSGIKGAISVRAAYGSGSVNVQGNGDYGISGGVNVEYNQTLVASGKKNAIYAGENKIEISPLLGIVTPVGGTVSGNTIVDANGQPAKLVVIGTPQLYGSVSGLSMITTPGVVETYTLSGVVASLPDDQVISQWQRSDDGTRDWTDISGATGKSYTVQTEDVGKYIRVKISATGYENYLYSPACQVAKAACATAVVAPTLVVSDDKVRVSNPQENQEYIIMTQKKDIGSLTASDWASSQTFDSSTQTMLFLGGTANAVNYVYTRVKEDDAHRVGTSVATANIYLGTTTYLQAIEMAIKGVQGKIKPTYEFGVTQDDLGAYYVRTDSVYEVTVKAIPEDATNFTGVLGSKWLVGGPARTSDYGTYYSDFKCTSVIDASTKYTTVYFKPANVKANYVELRVEYTKGYNDIATDACKVNIGIAGVYKVNSLTTGNVTVDKGDKQEGLTLTTRPAKAAIRSCIVTKTGGEGTAPVVTFDTESQTYSVDATNATKGTYTYTMLVNGGEAATTLTVEVTAVAVESIKLLPKQITLDRGASQQLTLQLFPSNAEAESVVWSSSSEKVATVTQDGVVTIKDNATRGLAPFITVIVDGTYKGSTLVRFPKLDPGLAFEENEFEVFYGQTFTEPELTNPDNLTVTYKSDDTSVATVDSKTGKVTIVGRGFVRITASYPYDADYNAGKASYTLWVKPVVGDVNGDGSVTIADVTALVNIILGKDADEPYLYDHDAADVNDDGDITIADVTALVNLILGKTGTLSNVALEYDVTVPKSTSGIVTIPLDNALLSAFGVTEAYVNENILQNFSAEGPESGKLMYFAYAADGTTMVTEAYAGASGQQSYWHDADGAVVSSTSGDKILNIGHNTEGFFVQGNNYAAETLVGTTRTQKVGLQYNASGKIYTATVTLNITIAASDATGSWVKK